MEFFSNKRLLWVIVLSLFAGVSCSRLQRPLHFSVILESAGNLRPGDAVSHQGNTVGSVLQIRNEPARAATIDVEIVPEHRKSVYKEAAFSVAAILDGTVVLLISDRPGKKSEIEEGDVIDARPGWLERLSESLRGLGGAARQAVENLDETIAAAATALDQSPEAEALRDSLAEAAADAATVARSRYRTFVKEELPKIEEKAQAYRKKLEREGRREEAEIFWKWFTRLAESARSAAEEELKAEADPGK